jgi:hypothetical protein
VVCPAGDDACVPVGCVCANNEKHATDIAIALAGRNHRRVDRELDFIGLPLLRL